MTITVEKLLAYVTIGALLVGAVSTWAIAFNRIAEHETAIEKLAAKHEQTTEKHDKRIEALERDDTIRSKLGQIQESVNYLTWRMEAVTKQMDRLDRMDTKPVPAQP